MKIALLSIMLAISTANNTDTSGDIEEAITQAMLRKLTYPSSLRSGNPYQVAHCRKAPKGCEARLRAFAEYFVKTGKKHQIDPWLLAAMSYRESGYNPFAEGSLGERGVLQIHPKNDHAATLRWYEDRRYRERCRHKVGACQQEIIEAAAKILARAIQDCGDLRSGLVAYNSGVCREESRYTRRILRTVEELRQLASAGGKNSA